MWRLTDRVDANINFVGPATISAKRISEFERQVLSLHMWKWHWTLFFGRFSTHHIPHTISDPRTFNVWPTSMAHQWRNQDESEDQPFVWEALCAWQIRGFPNSKFWTCENFTCVEVKPDAQSRKFSWLISSQFLQNWYLYLLSLWACTWTSYAEKEHFQTTSRVAISAKNNRK